jgi:hypothetical protein
MKRRGFIALLGVVALAPIAWLLAASAQQASKVYRTRIR